ncbi:hypothetical protein ACFL08_04800 [Patescibacteria group bacterium]
MKEISFSYRGSQFLLLVTSGIIFKRVDEEAGMVVFRNGNFINIEKWSDFYVEGDQFVIFQVGDLGAIFSSDCCIKYSNVTVEEVEGGWVYFSDNSSCEPLTGNVSISEDNPLEVADACHLKRVKKYFDISKINQRRCRFC